MFLHGLLVNGDLWRNVVPALAGEFRCITPDLPLGSHELPMKPDADLSPPAVAGLIADFLATLDLDGVTLVANDTGGALTQILLTTRPERVARVVLTNCDAFEIFPPRMFGYLKLLARIPGGLGLMAKSMRLPGSAAMPFAYGWLAHRLPSRDVLAGWAGPLMTTPEIRRDLSKLVRAISPNQTLDAAARFGKVSQPVMLAWGDADKFFSEDVGKRLAASFPNSRFEPMPGARTFVPEDQPERLAELVRDFARETAPSAAATA